MGLYRHTRSVTSPQEILAEATKSRTIIQLGCDVRQVRLTILLRHGDDARSLGFTNEVIGHNTMLLLECGLRARRLGDHTGIVTEHGSWAQDLNAHHAKLQTEALNHLGCNAGCHQLRTERTGFARGLAFREPHDGSAVDHDDDTGVGTAGVPAASVVSVLEAGHHDRLATDLRCRKVPTS